MTLHKNDIAVILYGNELPASSVSDVENRLVEKFGATIFKHFSDNKFYSMKTACNVKSMYEINRLRMFDVCIVLDISQVDMIDYIDPKIEESAYLTFVKGSINVYVSKVAIDPAIFYANSLTINRACEYVNFTNIGFYDYLKMMYIKTKCIFPLHTELFTSIA